MKLKNVHPLELANVVMRHIVRVEIVFALTNGQNI